MIVTKQQVEAAQLIMGLHGQPLSKDTVNAAYRSLALKVHPDVGGDPHQFVALDKAKHLLLAYIEKSGNAAPEGAYKREDCFPCAGKGHIKIRRHFGYLTVTCNRCRGSGDAHYEPDKAET